MDKVKRMLSSPVITRRVSAMPSRYFGVRLDELVRREGATVPFLVSKICEHIEAQGLQYEGLFRVNGNARSVDRIRASFDAHGDADLAGVDMTALASTLKMFLRELPAGVVPEKNTRAFVVVQQANENDATQCVRELRALIGKLPPANRNLLCYLCRFLVLVASREQENKMSAHALAIVFGPNLFRCSSDLVGLKEQGVTNYIVMRFVKNYDDLFAHDSADELRDDFVGKHEPPRRPPPPKFNSDNADCVNEKHHPGADSSPHRVNVDGMDEDSLDTGRSASPFPADSDRSECGSAAATPRVTPFHSQQVEMAISNVVSHHLFSDSPPGSSGSDEQTPNTPPTPGKTANRTAISGVHNAPVPAPRRKWRPKAASVQPQPAPSSSTVHKSDSDEEPNLTVQQRIQQLTERKVVPEMAAKEATRQPKQRPKSRAFELFESQGILIGMAPHPKIKPVDDNVDADKTDEVTVTMNNIARTDNIAQHEPMLKMNKEHGETGSSLEVVQRSSSTLTSFKRPPGPKNRRTPSRGSHRVHTVNAEDVAERVSVPLPDKPPQQQHQQGGSGEGPTTAVAPSIRFLSCPAAAPPECGGGDAKQQTTSPSTTTGVSPSSAAAHKPFVPPLDLSILHEHVDGSDAIPVDQGHSLSLQKTVKDTDEALVSPRMCKLRKKNNGHRDTDVPPSPPTQQYIIYSSSPMASNAADRVCFSPKRQDEDQAAQIKQITKKIQSYKRKIKAFEESFEREHGYRPSQSDKAMRADVKRHVVELARARKDLKRLKEELENEPPHVAPPCPSQRRDEPVAVTTTAPPSPAVCNATKMEETLRGLMQKLAAKRQDAGRPEELVTMSYSEIQEEKLAVQKALLYFESIHGRPSTKSEKDIMRPLYDRYRNVKKLLAKPLSPHEKSFELATVPEDTAIELGSLNCVPGASGDGASLRPAIRIPTAVQDEFDCLVTQLCRPDTLDVKQTGVHSSSPDASPAGPRHMPASSSLHELSLRQLQQEQQLMLADKKQLRKQLRSFEDNFFATTGRKVQKEDRAPMDSEYHDYKQIKARLKLLDALISKHNDVESEA